MPFLSAQEAADRWEITKRRVQVLCASGRIPGAVRVGNMWVLPADAEKPLDARLGKGRSGAAPRPRQENPIRAARGGIRSLTQDVVEQLSIRAADPHEAKLATLGLFAAGLLAHHLGGPEGEAFPRAAGAVAQLMGRPAAPESWTGLSAQRERLFALLRQYPFCCDDLLSWCYQYINRFGEKSGFWNTQFFTEKYMIATLVDHLDIQGAAKILDPACGGGNFLLYCFDVLARPEAPAEADFRSRAEVLRRKLFGFEIDGDLAMVASVNLRLKYLSLLTSHGLSARVEDFLDFSPNIFSPEGNGAAGTLEVCPETQRARRWGPGGETQALSTVLSGAEVILTNPPFQTVKGMPEQQKDYLKRHYPKAKCDMCNAFLQRLLSLAEPGGTVGVVSQNSWMYLDSFAALRAELMTGYSLLHIWELGSNAFYDLSGEKANAVLMTWKKEPPGQDHQFELTSLKGLDPAAVEAALSGGREGVSARRVCQRDLAAAGYAFPLAGTWHLQDLLQQGPRYGDFAVAMQGTSTGNARELIDYYWLHAGDPDWVPVSKGGGYARWQGLNHYCVKWGVDGSYIRQTEGSAIRNAAYFPDTELVFSDTGTAGLNVRTLLEGQIFVASGPGIRSLRGSRLAHLAFLNSRLASYYIRLLSPKLTVAAGYIAKLPVSGALLTSARLEQWAGTCLAAKRRRLRKRPCNLEFLPVKHGGGPLEERARQWYWEDLQDEWTQLLHEEKIEAELGRILQLTEADREAMDRVLAPKRVLAGPGEQPPSGDGLEALMARHLDPNCTLSRTKAKRNGLGCDGILEFLSQETGTSCQALRQAVPQAGSCPSWLEEKYMGLYLHALVLSALEYPAAGAEGLSAGEIAARAGISGTAQVEKLTAWLACDFNRVHPAALMNAPLFRYQDGEVTRLKGGTT